MTCCKWSAASSGWRRTAAGVFFSVDLGEHDDKAHPTVWSLESPVADIFLLLLLQVVICAAPSCSQGGLLTHWSF